MDLKKNLSLAALALSIGTTSAAHATVYTFNIDVSGPPTVVQGAIPAQNSTVTTESWAFNGDLSPFTLQAGDTVVTNVTFDTPITLQAGTSPTLGKDESVSVQYDSSARPAAQIQFTTTTSADFGGVTGDFLGDPVPNTVTQPGVNGQNIISEGAGGNLTDSSFTFTTLTITSDITAITGQVAPFDGAIITLNDDFNSVPAPGALALLGLGLIGLGGMRRKVA